MWPHARRRPSGSRATRRGSRTLLLVMTFLEVGCVVPGLGRGVGCVLCGRGTG